MYTLEQIAGIRNRIAANSLLNSIPFDENTFYARSFDEWPPVAGIDFDDLRRAAIYYLFQPLYNALHNNEVPLEKRELALSIMKSLIPMAIQYITSYYSGHPDSERYESWVVAMAPNIRKLGDVNYWKRARNSDASISIDEVADFALSLVDRVSTDKSLIPDYIVCCACGASEAAMLVAGILGVDIGFVKYTQGQVKILPEHFGQVATAINGANVAVIEENTNTGETLLNVLAFVADHTPLVLRGYAMHRHPDKILPDQLVTLENRSYFQAYTFSSGRRRTALHKFIFR
ncbi:MAG: hypothetical protein ABIG95_05310 [Candidatus Woesearchaeota archaeon]